MERRNFLRNSFLTGTGLAVGAHAFATPGNSTSSSLNSFSNINKPFNLDYAFHDGMFKEHGGASFNDQIKWEYDKDFRSIEDNGMIER